MVGYYYLKKDHYEVKELKKGFYKLIAIDSNTFEIDGVNYQIYRNCKHSMFLNNSIKLSDNNLWLKWWLND